MAAEEHPKKEYVEEMSLALDDFVKLAADKDVNQAINNKKNLIH